MARIVVLAKAYRETGRALIVGAFTQRKKVWGAIELLEGIQPTPACAELPGLRVYDDVLETDLPALYRHLCAILRQNGRAVFGRRVGDQFLRDYLLVEGELNLPRQLDLDEQGNPRPCPLKGGEAAEETTTPAAEGTEGPPA